MTETNGHPSAAEIAAALGEDNVWLVRRVVTVLGVERAQALHANTMTIEAAGGLLTRQGDRRRTPGGVFFKLAKDTATKIERRQIWPPGSGVAQPGKIAKPTITWAEAVQLIEETKAKAGEAKTVKLTLVGRPGKVVQKPTYVMITLVGTPPPSLPAGLPAAPEGSAITWAVFIARKQWDKASANLATQPEDKLVIDGYPVVQGGVTVLLAQSCKSMLQDRAAKQAQKAAAS